MTAILGIVLGAGLLLAGRKLFWLLVGAIGFLIGLEVAARITFPSEFMLIAAAVLLGVLFALMAVFLESVAIGIAGFFGGGLALMRLGDVLGFDSDLARILIFIVGGIIGVILVVWLFNWGLITISALAGASMIASGIYLPAAQRPIVMMGLVILGILIQGFAYLREGRSLTPRR